MMKKKFSWKKLSAIGMGAAMALSLAFGLGFSDFPKNVDNADSANNEITETVKGGGTDSVASNYAASVVEPATETDKLPTFTDGFEYWYTDYDEGLLFGAKTVGVDTDMKTVTVVKSGNAAGTQKNPWVINSKSDWDTFVTYVKGQTTKGLNEYFVLNCDLDYGTVTDGTVTRSDIATLCEFRGTFYGCGYKILNVNIVNYAGRNTASDNVGLGLFCYLTGTQTYISDLTIDNYYINPSATHVGPICGHGENNVFIVNCVTRGTIYSTAQSPKNTAGPCANKTSYNTETCYGALVGFYHSNSSKTTVTGTLNFYKCSVDFNVDLKGSGSSYFEWGLCGKPDNAPQGYAYNAYNVYDCSYIADIKATANGAWTGTMGGMLGFVRQVRTVNCYRNFCVQKYHLRDNSPSTAGYFNANLLGTYQSVTTYNIDDFYGYGVIVDKDNNNYKTPLMQLWSSGSGITTPKLGNNIVGYSEGNTSIYRSGSVASYAIKTTAANIDNFIALAKTGLSNDAVWNHDAIDEVTGLTDHGDIIESPIILSRIRVSYNEYKNNADVSYANAYETGETAGDWKMVKSGQTLYDPSKVGQVPANRSFLGWTTSTKGDIPPVKEVPKTWHGDIKLYAVWGLASNISVEAAFAAKNNKATMVYGDSDPIELQPDVTINDGDDPSTVMVEGFEVKYNWKLGTDVVGSTGESYFPQNVDDSGTYSYTFRMSSTTEPLWYYDGSSDNTVKVTITPVDVDLKAGSVTVIRKSDESTTFYYGMELDELSVNAEFRYGNKTVEGTVAFTGHYKMDVEDATEDENGDLGLYEEIKFTPKSNNYKEKVVNVYIYPQELKLNFQLSYGTNGAVDHTLQTGLEYGNNNTAAKIANDFDAAYSKFLDDNQYSSSVMKSVEGKRPYIVDGVDGASDENPISLDVYRTSGASIDNPTTEVTIKILLRYEEYEVTLDVDNGVDDPLTKAYGYGIRISQSDWPGGIKPERDGYEFLGWFVTDATGALTTEEWDPNTTRVTKKVSIKAKWFQQTLTLNRIEVEGYDKEGVFVAATPLQDGDLTVTAIYTGLNSKGETVEVPKTLSLGSGGYTLSYAGGNAPYCTARDVTVSYTGASPVTVTLEHVAKKKYDISQNSFRSVSYSVDDASKPIPTVSSADLGRNGYLKSVSYTYMLGGGAIALEDVDLTVPMTYWITAHFELKDAFVDNYTVDDIMVYLEIYEGKAVLTVKWDTNSLTYSGVGQHPTATLMIDGQPFVPSATDNIALEYVVTGSSVTTNSDGDKEAIIVGNYQVEVRIVPADGEGTVGYVLKDGTEADEQLAYNFKITKAKLAKPTAENELYYTGEVQSVEDLLGTTYDGNLMKLAQQFEATDAGSYRASVALLDTRNSEWEDGTTTSVSITWQIKKIMLIATWDNTTLLLGRDNAVPAVIALDELIGEDQDVDLNSGVLIYRGTTTMPTEVGSYQITVQLNNAALSKNYTIDAESAIWDFVVVPNDGVVVIDIQWDTATFKFDGSTHSPVATVLDMDGNEITVPFSYTGDTSAKWEKEGGYTVSVSVPDGYFIRKGATFKYNIVANEDGKGGLADSDNPFNPTGDPTGNDDGGNKGNTGNEGSGDTLSLPLWQLIVGGLSAVLFVFCSLKAFGEYGKYKTAKKEVKQLASITYSFGALPLLAVGPFLGMEESSWTIIAFVALGLFLLSAAVLFVMTKKRKGAELALAREQARIADEKEYAREEEQLRREEERRLREEQVRQEMREEQARRDNEMKMMFAAMQQGGGGYQQAPFQYDDMRSLLAETVQALLPAMQQMQALPPAQSDPNAYAQPNYGARSETEEMLRAQMAQQQEYMAQQEERMARQEALINQLLQNQQQPAYEEEEVVDDVSWLGESDEVVSLEESYGALSDEGKRAYYEIGSYIMSKPRTSQNDGRYAVLFKYRRKTLFKLCIKDDAPVLYYPEGSGRGEVRIADPASLGLAKSMIDRSVARIDSELN